MKFARRSVRPSLTSRLSPRGPRASRARRPSLGAQSLPLEARTLLTLSVTSFPIPLVGIVQPDGITQGPDGNLWFTETGTDKIGRMTAAGVLTEFPLPAVSEPAGSSSPPPGPTAIAAGPDGALWFTGIPGDVGRITTAGVVTEFAVPAVPPAAGSPAGTASKPAMLTAITAGPDGALWFIGVPGEVGRITTAGVVTEFPVPAVPPPAGSPAGTASTAATLTSITVGPDGALWFTGVPGEVGRITTAGVVTEFAVPEVPPPAGSAAGKADTLATLASIALGPDGALWFTGVPGEVGRITTAGVVSEFTVPGNFNSIAGLTSGPGGNLWFTEQEDGTTNGEQPAVGEITPAGMTTLYKVPQGTTLDPDLGVPVDPTVITAGPDGALWFGQNGAIGRITTAGTLEQFALPTTTATVFAITAGPDGAVWFAQSNSDGSCSIGMMTTSGTITEYPLPAAAGIDNINGDPDGVGGLTEGSDGDLWFTENVSSTFAIGRITAAGQMQTFALPKNASHYPTAGNITVGPDGNLWFTLASQTNGISGAIGKITTTGKVKIYNLHSKNGGDYYGPAAPSDIISGPDGKLWFYGTVDGKTGIARISTSGKLEPVIPVRSLGSMVRLPDDRVAFGNINGSDIEVVRATRSGTVAIHHVPHSNATSYLYGYEGYLTIGPDGNLWSTSSPSSIVRISGLDTIDVRAARSHGR